MTAPRTLDVRLHEALASSGLSGVEEDRAVATCEAMTSAVVALTVPHAGRAARNVVALALGEDFPALSPTLRGDLARLCEVAVVRGL